MNANELRQVTLEAIKEQQNKVKEAAINFLDEVIADDMEDAAKHGLYSVTFEIKPQGLRSEWVDIIDTDLQEKGYEVIIKPYHMTIKW